MDSTYKALLNIPDISKADSLAHVLPVMEKNSLLSVGQLCSEGYYVNLNIDGVTIFNSESNSIMKVNCGLDTGIWHINLCPKTKKTQISEAKMFMNHATLVC